MDISADLTRIALAEDGELKELYYETGWGLVPPPTIATCEIV